MHEGRSFWGLGGEGCEEEKVNVQEPCSLNRDSEDKKEKFPGQKKELLFLKRIRI